MLTRRIHRRILSFLLPVLLWAAGFSAAHHTDCLAETQPAQAAVSPRADGAAGSGARIARAHPAPEASHCLACEFLRVAGCGRPGTMVRFVSTRAPLPGAAALPSAPRRRALPLHGARAPPTA